MRAAMPGTRAIPPTLKMRERNNAEEKILHKRLLDIEADYRAQNKKLITEIADLNNILTEFSLDGGDHCLEYFNTDSSDNLKDTRHNLFKSMAKSNRHIKDTKEQLQYSQTLHDNEEIFSRLSEQGPSHRSSGKPLSQTTDPPNECVYGSGIKNIRCQHFPCVTPKAYNDIGFQIVTRPYPQRQEVSDENQDSVETLGVLNLQGGVVVLGNGDFNSSSPRSRNDGNKHGRPSVREKVRTLKHILIERKRKLAETKPRAWETNYGDPVPLRRIMNPLRPVPTEEEHL